MTRDINTATREELVEVPSISPSRAETILSWRDNHGPVSDLNELTEIPGVGEKTVQKMAEYFTASGTQDADEAEPDADEAEPDKEAVEDEEVTASGTQQDEPEEGEEGEGTEDVGEGGEESDEDGEEGDEDGEEDGDEDGDGEEDDPDEAA